MTKTRVYRKKQYGSFEERLARYESMLSQLETRANLDFDLPENDWRNLSVAIVGAKGALYKLQNLLLQTRSDDDTYTATL